MVKGKRFISATNDNYIGDWNTFPTPVNQKIFENLRTIRARAREQFQNDVLMRRYSSMMRNGIVGESGITLQSRVKKRNEELDKPANKAIEKAWLKWCEECDFLGESNIVDFQNLIINTLITDGEVFIVKQYDKTGKFTLQFVDAERCDIQHNEGTKSNGNFVVMGIEHDDKGRVVAYYFRNRLRTVHDQYELGGAESTRVPAEDVIHIYKKEQIGQTRGIPLIASPLYKLKIIDQYETSALIASKLGAAHGGFYYRDENSGESNIPTNENGEFIEERRPGEINIVPEGWRYDSYDPTYPQAMYPEFMKKSVRSLASGLNVSYNVLANDYSDVNFSSLRSALLEDRDYFKVEQKFLIKKFLEPVYKTWLKFALMNGDIKGRTGRPYPFSKLESFSEFSFVGRRWDWVDPFKDSKAKRELYDMGAVTLSEIIKESGRDPDEIFDEKMKENEILLKIREQEGDLNVKQNDNGDGTNEVSNNPVDSE